MGGRGLSLGVGWFDPGGWEGLIPGGGRGLSLGVGGVDPWGWEGLIPGCASFISSRLAAR